MLGLEGRCSRRTYGSNEQGRRSAYNYLKTRHVWRLGMTRVFGCLTGLGGATGTAGDIVKADAVRAVRPDDGGWLGWQGGLFGGRGGRVAGRTAC